MLAPARTIALVGLLAAFGAPAPACAQPSPLAGIDRTVTRVLNDWGVPGAAIAIVKDDAVVWSKGYGVRRAGGTEAVTPETIFAIGSLSKSFTAASLAMLVDEGRLDWDDKVADRLPGFAMSDPFVTREVTLRDLLSHRTGLPTENLVIWGSSLDRREVVRRMRYVPQRWGIRSHFEYQNLGYVAAGEVIPAVTGTSWDDFVHQRLFTPLGMARSATSRSELPRFTNVATPHAMIDGRMTTIAMLDLDNAGPAGSITSTALDMAQYIRMLLGQGAVGGRRLLSPQSMRALHAPTTIIPEGDFFRTFYPDAHSVSYGLGFIIHDYHDVKVVEHGGQTDGMHSTLVLVPELSLGVIVLTNAPLYGSAIAIGYGVIDAYLGRPPRDWSAQLRGTPDAADSGFRRLARVPNAPSTIPADSLVGRYASDLYGDAEVRKTDGVLSFTFLGRTVPLEPWHFDTYRPRWERGMIADVLPLVTFERDGRARVRALRFDAIGELRRRRDR